MSYIVCSKRDHRYQFDYNSRILDSLASCFHITTACTATFKYKDILYISYNSQITKQNKPLLDIQLQLIFEAITTNKVENTLALYLLLNRDFKDFVINQEVHEQNEEFKREIKLFIDTRSNLRLNFFEHIENQPLQEIYNSILDSYNGFN